MTGGITIAAENAPAPVGRAFYITTDGPGLAEINRLVHDPLHAFRFKDTPPVAYPVTVHHGQLQQVVYAVRFGNSDGPGATGPNNHEAAMIAKGRLHDTGHSGHFGVGNSHHSFAVLGARRIAFIPDAARPRSDYQSLADRRPELREPHTRPAEPARTPSAVEPDAGHRPKANAPRGTGMVAGFLHGLAAGLRPK